MSLVYNAALVEAYVDSDMLEGKGDGDYVTIEHNSPRVGKAAGIGGEVAISVQNDRTGTATISLWYGSEGSRILNGWKRRLDNGEDFIFAFKVIEIASGSSWIAEKAWVEEVPSTAFGRDLAPEEWVIGFESVDGDRQTLPGS